MKFVIATFRGKDSLGYIKGKKYTLEVWEGEKAGILAAMSYNLFVDHRIYIRRFPDGDGLYPYATIDNFLENWTNIKTTKEKFV